MCPLASMKTNGANAIGVGSGACHCGPQCYQLVYCRLQTLMVLDICATHAMTWRSPHGTPMLDSGAHNHWSTSCQNHYVATLRCWRPYLLLWFGMMRDACGGEHPAAHSSVTNVTTISFHADKDVFAVYSGMICAWKNYCLAAISSNSTNSN